MTSEGRFSPAMESDSEGEFLVVARRTTTSSSSSMSSTLTTAELGSGSCNHRIMVSRPSLVYPKTPTPMSAKETPVVAEVDCDLGRSMDDSDSNKGNGTAEILTVYPVQGKEERRYFLSIKGFISCACWVSLLLLLPMLRWLEGTKAGAPQCVYIRMMGIFPLTRWSLVKLITSTFLCSPQLLRLCLWSVQASSLIT